MLIKYLLQENTRLKARNTMLQGKLGVADKKNKSVRSPYFDPA